MKGIIEGCRIKYGNDRNSVLILISKNQLTLSVLTGLSHFKLII